MSQCSERDETEVIILSSTKKTGSNRIPLLLDLLRKHPRRNEQTVAQHRSFLNSFVTLRVAIRPNFRQRGHLVSQLPEQG